MRPLKIEDAYHKDAYHRFFFFLLYILVDLWGVLVDFVWIRLYEIENYQMNRRIIIT